MHKDKMLIKADNFFIAHECTFVDSLKYIPSYFDAQNTKTIEGQAWDILVFSFFF